MPSTSAACTHCHENTVTQGNDPRSEWRVEEAFDRNGSEQMLRDEELARAFSNDRSLPPVLRLYSWKPACLSIGFQQTMDRIDLDACAAHGIDVVRRPTGGRAVLHRNEITYSVILHEEERTSIAQMHYRIAEALLYSLQSLGEEAKQLVLTGPGSDAGFRATYSGDRVTNVACFASTARNEITCFGRKVVGSAQRRFGTTVLQHGSILLNEDHLLLPDLLVLTEERREQMRQMLKRDTISLSEVMGRPVSIEEVASCLKQEFVRHICVEPAETAATAVDTRITGQGTSISTLV